MTYIIIKVVIIFINKKDELQTLESERGLNVQKAIGLVNSKV